MKVGADVSEGAEHEQALDDAQCDHLARPWRAEHRRVISDKAARARGGGVAGMRDRIAEEFDQKRNGRDREERR